MFYAFIYEARISFYNEVYYQVTIIELYIYFVNLVSP